MHLHKAFPGHNPRIASQSFGIKILCIIEHTKTQYCPHCLYNQGSHCQIPWPTSYIMLLVCSTVHALPCLIPIECCCRTGSIAADLAPFEGQTRCEGSPGRMRSPPRQLSKLVLQPKKIPSNFVAGWLVSGRKRDSPWIRIRKFASAST